MQRAQANAETSEAQRKQRFRRTVILLLLAIALLLLGLLLFALATPDWQADGSRPPYDGATRAAICVSLILATMLVPVSLRELILALLPNQALGLMLGLLIGMTGLIAVPVEVWLVLLVTDELEPGAQQRYEDGGDDWDWDD
jgi:O-antigen/teichoic acid export membrane protein